MSDQQSMDVKGEGLQGRREFSGNGCSRHLRGRTYGRVGRAWFDNNGTKLV